MIESLQPVYSRLDFIKPARLTQVASMDQEIPIRHLRLGIVNIGEADYSDGPTCLSEGMLSSL